MKNGQKIAITGLCAALIMLAGVLVFMGLDLSGLETRKDSALEAVEVERVVDGDTIVVLDAENQEKRVRMIGINTPESVSPDPEKNTAEGEQASEYTKEHLPEGITVYLEYDEEREDQYGRTLAYVWLSGECDQNSYNDFCRYNFGAVLLQNTYCEEAYYPPNGKYRRWYQLLEITSAASGEKQEKSGE